MPARCQGKKLESVATGLTDPTSIPHSPVNESEGRAPRTAAEFLKGGSTGRGPKELQVLECNLLAVQIYQRCDLTFIGMNGHCLGVSNQNILSAMSLFRDKIPGDPDENRQLFDDVSFLGGVAARVINSKRKS